MSEFYFLYLSDELVGDWILDETFSHLMILDNISHNPSWKNYHSEWMQNLSMIFFFTHLHWVNFLFHIKIIICTRNHRTCRERRWDNTPETVTESDWLSQPLESTNRVTNLTFLLVCFVLVNFRIFF